MSVTLSGLEAFRSFEPAKARGDTADANGELGKCLLWRSLPSERAPEIRQNQWRQLGRLHLGEARLLVTQEMVEIEGTDLAKQRRILVCNLRYL